MFGYNAPTLKEFIGIPFAFGLAALAIARNFPSPEAFVFLWAVEINVAIVPAIFLIRQFTEQAENAGGHDAPPQTTAQPVKYLDMNKADNVYSQATDTVKVNAVMQFNKTLIEQYQGQLDVNLTEAFWLNKQPGADESRWTKAGGMGRADFVEFIERGILWKAYKKVGGQGKRVPDNWRKIAQLAQGYPLPTFEQLPKQ